MAERVTQSAPEVLTTEDSEIRVTQSAPEALTTADPDIRVTESAPETLTTEDPSARVTQSAPEVLTRESAIIRVTQSAVEVLETVFEARMSLEWELDCESDLVSHVAIMDIGMQLTVDRVQSAVAVMDMVVELEAITKATIPSENCITDVDTALLATPKAVRIF